MEYIQKKYGEQGLLKDWDKMCQIADPEYSQKLYETIKEHDILPDNLNGFVFLSPSANMGSKEIGLAKIVDQQLQNKDLDKKPLFIASDFFGTHDKKGNFKSRFDAKTIPDLDNVEFSFVSADANKLPIKDGAVNLIMDRMGAIWHTINSCLSSEDQPITEMTTDQKNKAREKVKNILEHYLSKLKNDGSIVVDAPDDARISTAKLLLTIFGRDIDEQLKQAGLKYSFIGEKDDRLLSLQKFSETNN